jgi:hypothetical protein
MSRRQVLNGAASAGAVGLAVTLAGAPALAATRSASRKVAVPASAAPATGTADGPAADEAVVVHLRDLRTGQMDVYRGTSHVRVSDRELAAHLARISS